MDQSLVRKASANHYAEKKKLAGHYVEGFFLDVYKDILSGELGARVSDTKIIEFITFYQLNVEQITDDEGNPCVTVFRNGVEETAPTLYNAVVTWVSGRNVVELEEGEQQ